MTKDKGIQAILEKRKEQTAPPLNEDEKPNTQAPDETQEDLNEGVQDVNEDVLSDEEALEIMEAFGMTLLDLVEFAQLNAFASVDRFMEEQELVEKGGGLFAKGFGGCVKKLLKDRKFKPKSKSKYADKQAAAQAMCAWIASRGKEHKAGKTGLSQGSPKVKGKKFGKGGTNKFGKTWGKNKGGGWDSGKVPLKRKGKKKQVGKVKRTIASVDDLDNKILETIQTLFPEDRIEEIVSCVDLFLRDELTLTEVQAYVDKALLEDKTSFQLLALAEQRKDSEDVNEDDDTPEDEGEED